MRASHHTQLCYALAIAWAVFSAACGQSSPAGNGTNRSDKSCSNPKADHSDCKFAVADMTFDSVTFAIRTDNPFDKVRIDVRFNTERLHERVAVSEFTGPPYTLDLYHWWDINWPKTQGFDGGPIDLGGYAAEAIVSKDSAQIERMTLEFRFPAVPVHQRIEFYIETVMNGGYFYTTEDPKEEGARFTFQICASCPTGAIIVQNRHVSWEFDPSNGTFWNGGNQRGQVFACNCDGYLPSLPHLWEECQAIGNPQEANCVGGIRIKIIYPDREEDYHRRP